jgi:hypothetical protein
MRVGLFGSAFGRMFKTQKELSIEMKTLGHLFAVALVGFLAQGCSSITTIDFDTPVGSKLRLKNEQYVFPAAVRLSQKTPTPKIAQNGYDIEIDIAQGDDFLTASGKLYVFEATLTDVDALARNYFRIPQSKIDSLSEGAAVTIEGMSADDGKLLYRAILGMKRSGTSLPSSGQ